MADTDIRQTDQTSMATRVKNFSVAPRATDGAQDINETTWDNSEFTKWFGIYKAIPEYKTAINAFATWVIGKGWATDNRTTTILENITGWGEDTFQSIMWNMIVTKKVGGDAFAEIIRNDKGTLINLKPLDPSVIRIVVNKKGIIKRYEQKSKAGGKDTFRIIPKEKMLHLCNDRVADEIHGTSITESIEWVINARNEAMDDKRRILHRSTIRIMEVDIDNTSRLANLKRDYAEAVNKGELLLIPKGTQEMKDFAPPQTDHLEYIRYLENFFYQALGVPKVILGGSEEFTESSAKIGYLTFEQVYSREVSELIADLWNQVAIRITINKPASIKNELLNSESKTKEQTGFQPNDTQAGKVEV